MLPVFALLLLELALRISGYGFSTAFFKEMEQGGTRYVIENTTFSLRFFPPELARWPTSLKFPAVKSPGTCRVFVLGESAAMGDPQPAYGASRYMEMLLRDRFPETKFEIVNLGITAINSHVILPIARECARREGDIWIVYMGNNEMVGPFGAATVFGSRAPPRAAVQFNLAVQKTRTGQLLSAALRNLGGKPKNTSWGGMQMFLENRVGADDPRRETVYRNFEANLRDIVDAGLDSGARVILSTVSVNLRDCPPFGSRHGARVSESERAHFEQVFAEAQTLRQQSDFTAAADRFATASKVDPHFAEAHYRRAECLLASQADAREHFQTACDTDALCFRADTRINTAIRTLAATRAHPQLVLCDAESALAAADSTGIAGRESFYEHVHFNFEGNYRLGKAWAEQVEAMLPLEARRNGAADWASRAQCERALGLTPWNRHFVTQSILRRLGQPPLSTQSNNAERLQAVRAEDEEFRRQQKLPGAVERVRAEYQALLRASPHDSFLYEGFANFLEAIGERPAAADAYRRIIELLPHDFYASLQLGRLLGELGSPADGQPFLQTATRLRPSLPEGWHELGLVLAAQAQFSEALTCMERAENLRPQDPANVCYTGKMLAKLGRRAEAVDKYRRAIEMRPEFWEARFELATELGFDNRVNEAMREYVEVLRLNPRHAVSHVNLGVLLARVNRLDEAVQRFEEALRLDPNQRAAREYLEQVRARQQQASDRKSP